MLPILATEPVKVSRKLLCLIILLLVANVAGIVAKFAFEDDPVAGLVPLFDFNTERNVPSIYSTIALALIAVLSGYIAAAHGRRGSRSAPWIVAAALFLFLSADELLSIHEKLQPPVRRLLDASGLFYYAWIVPYGAAVVLLVAVSMRFLKSLPRRTLWLFVVSGGVYLTGAVGFEMPGGLYDELYGQDDLVYAMLYTCGEFLEMLGVVIMIHALLSYIREQFGGLAPAARGPAQEIRPC